MDIIIASFPELLRLSDAFILTVYASGKKTRRKTACSSPFIENGIEKTGIILYNEKRRDCLK